MNDIKLALANGVVYNYGHLVIYVSLITYVSVNVLLMS